jgi:hypothetical protein
MAQLGFGEYRPDVSDTNQDYTKSVLNVLPQSDGYGPFKGANVFTGALATQARGVFFARNVDGSIRVFAGTATKLYSLDNTTLEWTDVSKAAGTYSELDGDGNWSFAQFNSVVVAVQANTVPQAFTLGSSSEFADLGGSPPQSAYVSVVNRFLVLSGQLSNPRRVTWSGLNAITTWTSGTTYSDFQDMPDGGNVNGVVGGEFGVILQDSTIRRMTFAPGADIIFQIERLAKDVGTLYPWSVVDTGGAVYFYSTKGFLRITGDGAITPIGKERVDRTFLTDHDTTEPQLVIGSAKPDASLILWTYKSTDFNSSTFNKALAYDTALDRWAPVEIEGEYLASLAKPGITLESLNTIGSRAISGAADNGSGLIRLTVSSTTDWATGDIKEVASVGGTTEANGSWTITVVDGTHIDLDGSTFTNAYTSGGYVAGSIDDLEVSLDEFSAATLNQMAVVTSAHKLAYFTGDNLEATLESAEQSGISKRLFIRGYYPLTDAPSAYASTAARENLNATPAYSTEQELNAQGFCPQRVSTRHARAKIRIPAATSWTYITAVEPDFTYEGSR